MVRDRKGHNPVRSLRKAKCFSVEHTDFSEMLITFSLSKTHSALLGSNPGRRPENEFPFMRLFMNFFFSFHNFLIYFAGEIDQGSAFRLDDPSKNTMKETIKVTSCYY